MRRIAVIALVVVASCSGSGTSFGDSEVCNFGANAHAALLQQHPSDVAATWKRERMDQVLKIRVGGRLRAEAAAIPTSRDSGELAADVGALFRDCLRQGHIKD